MTMSVSDVEIRKLAKLSRLSLNDEEIKNIRGDLDEIFEYISKLSRLDTAGVAEVHGGGAPGNAFRDDVAAPHAASVRAALVSSLPKQEADMAKVPAVFTRES